ncbi:hypothetical protein Hanom_Chr14g01266901 [Helianthus anomalus]
MLIVRWSVYKFNELHEIVKVNFWASYISLIFLVSSHNFSIVLIESITKFKTIFMLITNLYKRKKNYLFDVEYT